MTNLEFSSLKIMLAYDSKAFLVKTQLEIVSEKKLFERF
jgi:hypothetical protein